MKKNATPLFKRSVIRNTAKKVFLIALFCAAAGFLFAADTTPNPAKGSVEVSTWQLVKHGGWLMIPIGLCSLIALAYAAERFINLRLDKIIPEEFTGGLAVRLKAKDYKGARDLCKKDRSPFAEVFLAGLREVDNGPERMEKAIEDTGTREMSILRQNVRPLKIVSEIAPLLGLLGTIQGMMGAFQKISEVGIGKKTEIFAGNIFQALVTTAAGLTVAIPALFLFYYFVGKIDKIILVMDRKTGDLFEEMREGNTSCDKEDIASEQAAPKDNEDLKPAEGGA